MAASHTVKISPEVQAVLNTCTEDTATLTLRLPQEPRLERDLYTKVAKVINAAEGKWNRKTEGFVFPTLIDLRKCKAAINGTGEIVKEKTVLQKFYTPDEVADELVERSGICTRMAKPRVLEPSCGNGSLIRAILRRVPLARVSAGDIDPRGVEETARAFAGNMNVAVTQADFLHMRAHPDYDFVLMNPPYQNGQAKAHVAHAWNFLASGGTLAAIVPANFDCSAYRDVAETRAYEVPAGAFKESGTMIATKILVVKKP